jgi:AcrR family transcriptional regulator
VARADRRAQILQEARTLLESEGAACLTMRRLAERLGIQAPSLYKHVADKDALEAELIAEGFVEAARAFTAATRGASDPLRAIAEAYRRFALEHPHLYRLMTERPLPRDRLPPGVEDAAAAPLVEATGTVDRARAAWAFAHGMVALELAGRFPPNADLDAAWREGIAALAARQAARRPIVHSVRGPD